MLTGLLEVSFLSATVAFNREARLRCAKAQHMLDVAWVQHGFATAEVPAHQLHRKSTAQHDSRSLGIAPDVVFGRRSHVALATRRAAHDHAAANLGGDAGIPLQGQSNIRKRSQGHQD